MERSTLISVEEYLATSYRPDEEYVDGTLVERNVGEWDHSHLQMVLSAYLFNRREELGIHVVPKQRVQVKPTRFRVPDICAVAGEKPGEQILTRPPFLCVEILSKDDRMSEMQERIDDYLSFGVSYVWVVDPRMKRAYVYTSEATQEVKDFLRTRNPDISVPLSELFSEK